MKRALFFSALLLAACGRSEDEAPADPVTPVPTPTVSAAPSALSLAPLQDGDGRVVADNMSNVGGCAFHDKDGRPLVSVGIPDNYDLPVGAGGDAIGVARINGAQIKLTAEKADAGYVEAGPKLVGGGYTVSVLRGPGEGKTLDREEVEYPADLIVSDGGGDTQTYPLGGWRCGV